MNKSNEKQKTYNAPDISVINISTCQILTGSNFESGNAWNGFYDDTIDDNQDAYSKEQKNVWDEF